MNLEIFYNLKNRLYSCAAAGCSAVNEDFRLKKAVEEFAPLAQANKVFGRIYALCMKLFDAAEPAPVLSECIALIDAVAVTQGGFSDNSETEKPMTFKSDIYSMTIPYSSVSELCTMIKKFSPILCELNNEDIRMLADSRVLSAFISVCGASHVCLDRVAEYMIDIYGKALVPLLKNHIDLSADKAKGTEIKYIGMISGSEERDFYISLAENENAPQNIRIEAISALGKYCKDKDKLTELYQTEKGKIKNTALLALSGMDCPETEEILGKLIEKHKSSYDTYIAASCGKVCTDYVISAIESTDENSPSFYDIQKLMKNKPRADKAFITAYIISDTTDIYNNMLIDNLYEHDFSDEYKELIHRLYERKIGRDGASPFAPAEFFVRLIDSPDTVFLDADEDMNEFNNEHYILTILSEFYYDIFKNKYYIRRKYTDLLKNKKIISEKLPDGMITWLCGSTQNAEDRLRVMLSLMKRCADSDREHIKSEMIKYAVMNAQTDPVDRAVEIISEYYMDGTPDFYKDMIRKYILNSFIRSKNSDAVPSAPQYRRLDFIDKLPISPLEASMVLRSVLAELDKFSYAGIKAYSSVLSYQKQFISMWLSRNGL
ncbi:MAG: hypothetical protein IJ446_09935 [Oscillospiraceae bacterium]|nr:hypothetical protein [Oscillospiraceae bacterium]